ADHRHERRARRRRRGAAPAGRRDCGTGRIVRGRRGLRRADAHDRRAACLSDGAGRGRRRPHRRGGGRGDDIRGGRLEERSMTQATAIGSTIGVEELERDPYPAYARLRSDEPVSWVESVGLWLVTRWDDVNHVIKTPDVFTAETEPSTLNRTFGKNLLGSEGPYHQRIRS